MTKAKTTAPPEKRERGRPRTPEKIEELMQVLVDNKGDYEKTSLLTEVSERQLKIYAEKRGIAEALRRTGPDGEVLPLATRLDNLAHLAVSRLEGIIGKGSPAEVTRALEASVKARQQTLGTGLGGGAALPRDMSREDLKKKLVELTAKATRNKAAREQAS